jgi:hypothetical protein
VPLSRQQLVNRHLLLRLLLVGSSKSVPLGLNSLLSPLSGSLGLCTLGVHLFLEDSLTLLFGLGLVDLLHCQSHTSQPSSEHM